MNSEWAEPPQEPGSIGKATPGAQLAAKREAMGWTVEQIADQLKLAVRQVRALEAGDYAALPNAAVTRGFVRAYAKVLKMDPTPLVAMLGATAPAAAEVVVPRRDLSASFSESRFPSMTGRSSAPAGWLIGLGVAVVLAGAGAYAYQSGLIPASLLVRKEVDAKPAEAAAPALETTLVKPGQEASTLQQPNVPLISVPPQGEQGAASGTPAAPAADASVPAPTAPAPTVAVSPPAVATPAPAAPAPAVPAAAGGARQLVLKVNEDSWVEIRRPGTTALISRVVKAGSTETFDIKDAALLIVGKPGGVEATLAGAPLALPTIPGGTIARVNIK